MFAMNSGFPKENNPIFEMSLDGRLNVEKQHEIHFGGVDDFDKKPVMNSSSVSRFDLTIQVTKLMVVQPATSHWRMIFWGFLDDILLMEEIRWSPPDMHETLETMGYLLHQLGRDFWTINSSAKKRHYVNNIVLFSPFKMVKMFFQRWNIFHWFARKANHVSQADH